MIKLVMLEPNPSVSEQEPGDSRWVYVDGEEFDKKSELDSVMCMAM